MKAIKFSVAAAAALAFATVASADGLTAYGVLSGEVGSYYEADGESNVFNTHSYASRFGLKGAKDIGGGLTAVYQAEVGFNPVNDDSASAVVGGVTGDDGIFSNGGGNGGAGITSRNTFVGLAGGFGTFVIGNHDTPYKIAARGAGTVAHGDAVDELKLNVDRSLKGAVAYIAPADALGGVTLAVAVVPVSDANDARGNNGQHLSLGVLAPLPDAGIKIGAGYESAWAPAYKDSVDSFFVAVNWGIDIVSVGVAFESTTVGDKILKDSGYTTILVPVNVTLDDGLFVNFAAKITDFDKQAGALAGLLANDAPVVYGSAAPGVISDETLTQVGLSVGKKWGSDFEAYVGAKLTQWDDKKAGSKDSSATDFGAGIRVTF